MVASQSEFIERPFLGLPGERALVAFREIVPAATGVLRLDADHGGEQVTAVTLLPNFWPAWKRTDNEVFVALQTRYSSGDPSRDMALALLEAIQAEPGTSVDSIDVDGPGQRLQDICDLDVPFDGKVLDGFDYWVDPASADDETVQNAIEQAKESIAPTVAIKELEAAYWTRLNGREFLRWSIGLAEDEFLDALASLQAKREAGVMEDAKYAGAFRSCGLIIPVWELPRGVEADELPEPAAEFRQRLDAALRLADQPLTSAERRSRAGLVARSVTLR